MYEQARLKAVEELMIELLRLAPGALDRLIDEAHEPLRFLFLDDESEAARSAREHQQTVRAAKQRLLTRAKYPHGLLAEHEIEPDLVEDEVAAR